MDLYVSDEVIVVACNGASALFHPGVPRPLRDSLIGPALTKGAKLVGQPTPEAPAADAPSVEAVAAAIKELMAEGNASLFAVTGEPKLVPLRGKAGKGVTEALRDAAWALVQAEA